MKHAILTIGLATLTIRTLGVAQSFPLPDIPPRASLIEVSSPDAAGEVTVVGRPGTVPANYFVILVTMDTGHFAHTQAAADGSFRVTTYAPYGTSIMVKADARGETLNRALSEIQSGGEGALAAAPATIVRGASNHQRYRPSSTRRLLDARHDCLPLNSAGATYVTTED